MRAKRFFVVRVKRFLHIMVVAFAVLVSAERVTAAERMTVAERAQRVDGGDEADGGAQVVVQIVVPQLSQADLERYAHNFSRGGFRLFMEGVSYDHALYDFAPTTPSALATLTTGANPSVHGIIGSGWWSHSSEQWQGVVYDKGASSYGADNEASRVSNKNISVPTVGDMLCWSNAESKVVAVAADASSAIVMGGRAATDVWWIDSLAGRWTTSTKYQVKMPRWVRNFNSDVTLRRQMCRPWVASLPDGRYVNSSTTVLKPYGYELTADEKREKTSSEDILKSAYSPIMNEMVLQFAKEATIYNSLGADQNPDLLMVSFDALARVAERYGRSSREWEDAIYRLDAQLAELMNFISAQCRGRALYVLCSDGCGDGRSMAVVDAEREDKLFNTTQFAFLVGSYMNATYGKGDWVLGYADGGLWLNRTLMMASGLDVEKVQRAVATFALQFSGLSHIFCASDMFGMGAKSGVAQRVQNGFYPSRSADLYVVLMPSWSATPSDQSAPPRSTSGSVYNRRTPLYFAGYGIDTQQRVLRTVDAAQLAPTVAALLGIDAPVAADASPLEEVL